MANVSRTYSNLYIYTYILIECEIDNVDNRLDKYYFFNRLI